MLENVIQPEKYVELTYRVLDRKTGQILTAIEYPLGYVHGVNEILSPRVMSQLDGRSQGETVEVPIDCNAIYGPRDESLVITDYIQNVPEEFREVGTSILMENDKGETKTFLVTRLDEKTITIDGNNPLCGRDVIFSLTIGLVRDATEEEIAHGGKIEEGPDIHSGRVVSI